MTIKQIRDFYLEKENTACPICDMLVRAGYQQKSDGYIKAAKNLGILVDYKQNSPSQYWHLMHYCDISDPQKTFSKSIVCGELIFWMAEVANAVPAEGLMNLARNIINSAEHKAGNDPIYDRKKWNKEIQILCFDRIQNVVEQK